VTASTGIALAGNLITFFIFFEFLTLVTYPLVVHRGTEDSLRAGRTYLWYTISGGTVLFLGVVWVNVLVGPVDFGDTGALAALGSEHRGTRQVIFAILIAGLGVKAALVPLHGWLPVAMVAPAPVSALLHAVAVVKAGAFGIVRVVYDVYGVVFADSLGVLLPLAILASITIIYGSLRALVQDDLKKRLAYSTVSQLSYITLGVATLGTLATTGSLVHLIHQGVMKITLFFCAGAIAETLGLHRVSELNGIGRRMPLTMAAFTVAAYGMIGLPPLAGFVSKWYLAFFGFGVKAGVLPLHFWLPLAHPVAPVPASAVLSGAMIKAGLLGWLHFLPLGHAEFPGWGLFCIAAGMAAALGAVVVGCMQNDPKTLLAYSSVSQMGVMTLILGIGLTNPGAWLAALPVLLLYALNHALAKGALFFGTGVAHSTGGGGRRWVMAGLALPALALAGAPWTGGSMTKYAIKDLIAVLFGEEGS
jgi:formate hydrogenlyase subunit 3/multisubunit Na+/H+ antiporter MnhD subunit